ncbi:MAG: flavodoxin [Lachnospiraceae bacterium]|nr:flavodoxin [Lachnospiraceae bacterium]
MKKNIVKAMMSMALMAALTACGASGASGGASTAASTQAQTAQEAASETAEESASAQEATTETAEESASAQEATTETAAESASAQTSEAAGTEDTAADQAAAGDTDTLVIYFSRMGVTDYPDDVDVVSSASLLMDGDTLKGNAQVMAEWIAEETGGDLFEILTVKKYSADYNECITDARQEQGENARPELANTLTGLENYDKVHFVFPNWWGDLPMPVYTFFETYDFAGKQIIVSCTHGGSRFSGTVSTIGNLEPEAEVTEGIELYADNVPGAREDVISWVRGL